MRGIAGAPRTVRELVVMLLVASSLAICIWVVIDDMGMFIEAKAQGATTGWLEGPVGGAILICGPGLVALWLSLRRRPAGAACFAVLGLLMAGASWIGMRG